MKITLINTTDAGGGAPAACMRLLKALLLKGQDARMTVQQKKTEHPKVTPVANSFWTRLIAKYHFYRERVPFMLLLSADKSVNFAFSTAKVGTDITDVEDIQDADILHLHWTNQGFQSTRNLTALTRMGKPVVWTLHDMWAFTGGCHYAGECDHFKHSCGHCWMLKYSYAKDLSYKGWRRKMHLFSDPSLITFVTCSNWLANEARKSSLLKGYRIEAIPNPIDTDLFSPKDVAVNRAKWKIPADKKIILFGAANIMDRRKGIIYLVEALELLKPLYNENIEIVIFGKNKAFDMELLPFKVHEVGLIDSETDIAELYSLSDVYVTPAIEDNLPNTVMEALACGTPVVAFDTGGLADMVDHQQNGYLAEFKSVADFAEGVKFVLNNPSADLSNNARQKVLQNFSNEVVAEKYLEVYRSLLN
ncbi:glycosyltransferase family 4 protein [Mucilaginibacter myungsuensis]|uniref:Glycosyltransferase family 4 protein n=1 Tax=Mucilaginibacter myungsuensis TaxID=649104 RepID=A0A929KZ09_9SPHI|nr:glycosyltransferase family 4 protein [Mucilaginibacter myungsuensis]MBE9663792.1 glycosyltransferase family 4 protein [Mucilaginibacter myungsuensis]MDN3598492.1 glycosyltransferase family 4 protein [Mucilaginibacter myungsuensis]